MLLVVAAMLALLASPGLARGRDTGGRTSALVRQARWLERSGNLRRAVALLEHAIRADPAQLAAYLDLSRLLARLGRHRQAIRALRGARPHLGQRASLSLRLGYHLAARGELSAAFAALTRARRGDTRSRAAALLLGDVALRLRRFAVAARELRRALAGTGGKGGVAALDTRQRRRARLGLALALLRLGRNDAAARQARRLLERGAPSGNARARRRRLAADAAPSLLLASALAAAGRCREAAPLLARLGPLADSAPAIAYNSALCAWRAKKHLLALRQLARYERLRALRRRGYLLRARALRDSQQHTAALLAFERAAADVARGGKEPAAAALRRTREHAAQLLLVGRPARARAMADAALTRHRALLVKRPLATAKLLAVWSRATLRSSGGPEAVVARLSRGPQRVDPSSTRQLRERRLRAARAELLWLLGVAHYRRGSHAPAVVAFEASIDAGHAPRSRAAASRSLGALARAALVRGALARCQRLLERARALAPLHRPTRRNLGLVALLRGRAAAALRWLRPLVPAKAHPDAFAVHHLLARAYTALAGTGAAAQLRLAGVSRRVARRRAARHYSLAARAARARLRSLPRRSRKRRRALRLVLQRVALDQASLALALRRSPAEVSRAAERLRRLLGEKPPAVLRDAARSQLADSLLRRGLARLGAKPRAALTDFAAALRFATTAAERATASCARAIAWASAGSRARARRAFGGRGQACAAVLPGARRRAVRRLWRELLSSYADYRRSARERVARQSLAMLQRSARALRALRGRARALGRRRPAARRVEALAAQLADSLEHRLAAAALAAGRPGLARTHLARVGSGGASLAHDRLVIALARSRRRWGASAGARSRLAELARSVPRAHLSLAAAALRAHRPAEGLAHLRRAQRAGLREPKALGAWVERLRQLLGVPR